MFFSSYDEDDQEYGFQELQDALINQRDFEAAKSILEKFPECINDIDNDGKTVLHHAAESGNTEVVSFLLQYPNIDVNPVDDNGNELCYAQPLHYAAYEGHTDVVKLLISHKETELDKYHGIGLTPLQEAVLKGHISIVELLLQAKVSPHRPSVKSDPDVAEIHISPGSTPIRMAVILQDVEMAKLLLSYGANINDVLSKHTEKYGDLFDDNYIGQSLLSIAVNNGDLEMVKLLCKHDPDKLKFNRTDSNGLTPFFYAVLNKHDAITEVFFDYSQVKFDFFHKNFVTPFYQAVVTNRLELVKKFLSLGKDKIALNRKNSNGLTPLHVACRDGFTQIAHLLIRTPGIDLNAEDIDNLKPLDYAIQGNHEHIIRHLRHKRGVDPNKKLENTGIKRAYRELLEEYLSDIGEENFGFYIADSLAENELAAGNYDYTHLVHPDEGLAPVHIAAKYANPTTLNEVVNFTKLDLDLDDGTKKTAFDHLESRRKKRKLEDTNTNLVADYSSNESSSYDDETTNRKKRDILESAKKRRKYEERYSSEGSSTDDSDDDFEPKPYLVPPADEKILDLQKQWQKNPPKNKKILIAEYRGVTFKSLFFSKEDRRKKYEEIRLKQPRFVHSSASLELAGYETDDELVLQKSKHIHAVMREQEQREPFKTKGQKNKKPSSVADQDFARYITDQVGYSEDLKQWHTGEILKEKQEEFSRRFENVDFTQNPYVSFGDHPKQPQKFGYGLNSDYPTSQTLPRLRQTTGKTKRPCLGYLIIALFTPDELKQSAARHAPTLISENRIGVGLVYKHAREMAFLGYVHKKNIVAQIKLRIPSFEKYKPIFEKKYGLSKEQFNRFRKKLIDTKEKSQARKKSYIDLINNLIEFLTQPIINYSMAEAHKRNAVLMYQDLQGGYTNKLPEITKQKQVQQDIDAMAEELSAISLDHFRTNDDMQIKKSATTVFRK